MVACLKLPVIRNVRLSVETTDLICNKANTQHKIQSYDNIKEIVFVYSCCDDVIMLNN